MATLSAIGVGATNITTLGTITTGTWQATPVALAYNGTGSALTASNGGIVYSTASALAILSGTATANQMLQSGASTTPAWSTATWPNTVTQNNILYASATNVVSGLATANTAVLTTDSSGNLQWTTGGLPVAYGGTGVASFTAYAVLCGGTTTTGALQQVSGVGTSGQVLTSAGAGTLPVWSNPASGVPINQNTSSVTMAKGNVYVINNGASLVTLTLPAAAAVGDVFTILGQSSGGWKVAQNSGQICYASISTTHTTSGATGHFDSADQYNACTITCIIANTTFVVSAPLNSTLSYT